MIAILQLHVKQRAQEPTAASDWLLAHTPLVWLKNICWFVDQTFRNGFFAPFPWVQRPPKVIEVEQRKEATSFHCTLLPVKNISKHVGEYFFGLSFCLWHFYLSAFNVHRLWNVTIFRVTETWRPTSWPGTYTSWWQFAQQPVLVFPLSLSRLSFPPSESPRGNCGIIYEVVAAWSRPVYGMACWPKSIQPRRSGLGFLLC